jgi:hypothetical protein
MQHLPVLIVTLRNHTLSPAVERFVACARDIAKAMQPPKPLATARA